MNETPKDTESKDQGVEQEKLESEQAATESTAEPQPQSGSKSDNREDVWTQGPEIKEPRKASGLKSKLLGSASSGAEAPEADWERDILNRLAFASLNEQRRSRRWGIFFKILTFVYIGAVLFYLPGDLRETTITGGPHTALVEIDGVIASDSEASADLIVTGLRAAFKDKNTKGVILRINSPGGSPVQAGYVYDEIKRLREKHENTKVYAVIVDVCASGGYYIAAAADEIYADKASLVGSIGVLMNGFGFVGTMDKLGVERRLITAGDHKAMMDPFSPLKKEDKLHMQNMIDGVHQQFINVVKEGRGDRLKDNPDLFSGLVWNGDESVELGLVDGLGSSSYVARDIIGAEKIVDFTPRANFIDRFASQLGASFAKMMMQTMGSQDNMGLRY
ncbi:signal peptide peptidase SppA [Kaarinaea lacus]